MYRYVYICTTPSSRPTAQKIQILIDVSRNLCLEKMFLFKMILSLPFIHKIPTQCAVCDQHSVLLSKSAMVDANCFIIGKHVKEKCYPRLQSALILFPQVRSSIPAEPYNMWKHAFQRLMKLSLHNVILVWTFNHERLHFSKQPWRHGLPLSKKQYSCRNIQYVERWNMPFNKVQTPSQFFAWHLLWKEHLTFSK